MEQNKSLVPQISWRERELIIPDFSIESYQRDGKPFSKDLIPDYKDMNNEKSIEVTGTEAFTLTQTSRQHQVIKKKLMPLQCSYLRMRDLIDEIMALKSEMFQKFIELSQIEVEQTFILRKYVRRIEEDKKIHYGKELSKKKLILKRIIPTIKVKESLLSYLMQQSDIEMVFGRNGRILNKSGVFLFNITPYGCVERKYNLLEYSERLEKHREYFVKRLTEEFSNISSDTGTFDDYIDAWAKRLLKGTEDLK